MPKKKWPKPRPKKQPIKTTARGFILNGREVVVEKRQRRSQIRDRAVFKAER